jgi:hypothetical protein
MKKYIVIVSFSFFSLSIFSQPSIQWDKTIGGSGYDDLGIVQQTADGGYVVGGYSTSNVSGDKTENRIGIIDYWIVKLNSSGNIQWDNTVGANSVNIFNSLEQTDDGGYILGGWSNSSISGDKTENSRGGHDYWVVKLNSAGTIQWDRTIGGSDEDELYSVRQTSDGGYILGGYSRSNISGDKTENSKGYDDYWVVKIGATGNIEWQKTLGGSGSDQLIWIRQTTDMGYILGGISNSDSSADKTENGRGDSDYWILKIDSVGNIQWQKTIGGSNMDILHSIEMTFDGGYIVGGMSISNISGDKTENICNPPSQFDYWIIKIDFSGNIQWQNDIGSNGDNRFYSVCSTVDSGFVIGGYSDGGNIFCDKTENPKGGTDYWILKLDFSGNILWQKTIGGSSNELFYSVEQTLDGGLVLGGESLSNISGDKTENSRGASDFWVVKLAPFVGMEEPNNVSDIEVFPNPATDELKVQSSKFKVERIEIFDMLSQLVHSKQLQTSNLKPQTYIIDVSELPAGIYFVQVKSEKQTITKKLLLQK